MIHIKKVNQEQVPAELQNSKAALGSDGNWAESYARYYQTQNYAEQQERRGSRTSIAALVITAVLLTLAGGIMVLAVFGPQLLALFSQEQENAELAAVSVPETQEETVLTAEEIRSALQNIGDSCSQQTQITGMLQHEEGEIPFLSKRSWTMTYQASATVGFSTADIQVQVENGQIIITLPEAILQELTVDPESISYADEVQPMFGMEEGHDPESAIAEAQADAEQRLDLDSLKAQVEQQAENAVLSALSSDAQQYQLIIRHL